MKQLIVLLMVIASAVTTSLAENYSIEATLTRDVQKDRILVTARIAELSEKNGQLVEKIVSQPRVNTAPGVPASMYFGASEKDAHYKTSQNISVDVSWPKPGEKELASCSVVIKRGDTVVSKSKFQLQVNNP